MIIRGPADIKYPTKQVGDPSEIAKAKEWGVSVRFLKVLRAVYKHGMPISKSAKEAGFSVSYARRVFWRLRKTGFEDDIIESLKP